jgi:hypothetical protein
MMRAPTKGPARLVEVLRQLSGSPAIPAKLKIVFVIDLRSKGTSRSLGPNSAECSGQATGRARIRAGGVERDVTVEDAGDPFLDGVHAGYRRKYAPLREHGRRDHRRCASRDDAAALAHGLMDLPRCGVVSHSRGAATSVMRRGACV